MLLRSRRSFRHQDQHDWPMSYIDVICVIWCHMRHLMSYANMTSIYDISRFGRSSIIEKRVGKIFPLQILKIICIFGSGNGILGATLSEQLGFWNFSWLSIYQKGMGIAWELIYTKILCFSIFFEQKVATRILFRF